MLVNYVILAEITSGQASERCVPLSKVINALSFLATDGPGGPGLASSENNKGVILPTKCPLVINEYKLNLWLHRSVRADAGERTCPHEIGILNHSK